MIRRRFLDGLTRRNNAIPIQKWLYISKFEACVRLARDRQDFVRPSLGVIIDREAWWHSPVWRFMRRHVIHELLLKRFDLCFELVLPQCRWQLWEKGVYCVIVPKRVKF